MDDGLARRETARPRRVSAVSAAELGANASLQDGEANDVQPPRETPTGPDRPGAAACGIVERRHSVPPVVHQRHMPMEPNKFHIPRKTKEKRALHSVSTESREYEDMMTILTSSYIDTSSAGCFTYSSPRLVHSELLEKEFVEKRKEMKADGRTDKELEESYGFLLADTVKVSSLTEKGLCVGHSWITALGNPSKGVYLSRYSDLLQVNALTPGASGEIIIFKVLKGKVKSIYENMKNLLDPTPRFDSHVSKNASKVTSLASYRAFELTQQYFYEYSFDELRPRPRHVCPYAVVSFHFKGKDSSLPSKPLAPVRLNSQSAEGSKERTQFTVWTGELVKGDRVLFQISLRSFFPPFLPHRLPEKLNIGFVMRLEQATRLLPSSLFSYNLYSGSQEVVKNGHCCSLLEVVDRNRSTTSVTKLLQELEMKRVVLVTPLTDRGFLFLLSSVQMATPSERGESWRRCLQALFVFPETRDVSRSSSRCAASESSAPSPAVMPRLSQFIPALHHALVKARANPPPELSAGVERQAREYLAGLTDGKVRPYPMGEYDSRLDSAKRDEGGGKPPPAPKPHRANVDSYLRSYLYSPALYLLSVARARQAVEVCCGPEEPKEARSRDGQREATGKEVTGNARDRRPNYQKMQRLVDLVLTCTRNAENEVKREEGGEGAAKAPGRKRRLEQKTAERALKFLKAAQEPGGHNKVPVEGGHAPPSAGSLLSLIGAVGLRDVDLRDGSELGAKLLSLLTGLNEAARGTAGQSLGELQEEEQREPCPFDRLATRLGLPTNCDIDLRRQEELEEQTAGSVSSLEGFSPSSHSGEMNHLGAMGREGGGRGGRGLGRRTGVYEEEEENGEIPWILIPITGLCSERYTQRDRNIPQDPRFQHLAAMATSITTPTDPAGKSPARSPGPSPPPSPFPCPSPEPSPPLSPSQCPSPDPSPPPSPSQCPSPEPSPPLSLSQCPSPEPSPVASPAQCPSPQLHSPPSPSQCASPQPSRPPSPSWCRSPEPRELHPLNEGDSGANEQRLAPALPREFAGMSKDRQETTQGKAKTNEKPSVFTSIQPSVLPAPGGRRRRRRTPSPPPASTPGREDAAGHTAEVQDAVLLEEERETQPREEGELTPGGRDGAEARGEAASGSSPPRPLRDIDGIVDKHLGDFSSEMRLLLRGESVHYSRPPSPHSAPDGTRVSMSPFSQYVSFYNPCLPVQDYVASLQDSIDSIITEVGGRPEPDASLASTVSAFVASIRAGNAPPAEAGRGGGGEGWRPDAEPSPSHWKPAQGPAPEAPEDSGFDSTLSAEAAPRPASQPVPAPAPAPAPVPAPPATALSSLISQLQPEVFNDLEEIIRDVKKNSLQFYLHSTEPGDQVHEDVKEKLLKQGNVEQSPVAFLNQENSDDRLLVIIKNKDIAVHVHEIPSLVNLKRHPSVVFVGIDTLDDISNNSYNELFVSGGCVVSDELVLNPDCITHGELAGLLMLLEQHSSQDSVWRWKVHCKTHKRLKEQARFRRDAANMLDVLSAFQKRQVVEFLPYHHCDMMNHPSPDLGCLVELQARYTQYRHTVFLTRHRCEKLAPYSGVGIIVASVDEIHHGFARLVGYHDIKEKQPIMDDLLATKGPGRRLSRSDSVSGSERSPSSFPELAHMPQRLLLLQQQQQQQQQQPHPPAPGLLPLPHVPDQLVPDGTPQPSDTDFEVLRLAISQFRAARHAQQQQQQQQQQQRDVPGVGGEGGGAPLDSGHPHPGRKAVADTLELIHSALQQELGEDGPGRPAEAEGFPGQRGAPLGGKWADAPAPSASQSTATVTGPGEHADPENRQAAFPKTAQHTAPPTSSSSSSCPAEADGPRDSLSGQEQPMRGEGAAPGGKVTGSVTMVTGQEALPRPQHQHHLQHLNNHHHHHAPSPRGAGLLQTPPLPRLPGPVLRPVTALGGIRGLLGPSPVWPGGLSPARAAALVWGFQQAGSGSALLGGFPNPAGQGSGRYRGGQRGGFNGM